MKAMVLEKAGNPLVFKELADPVPRAGQIVLDVIACAICRTDLHIIDGELKGPKFPLILGHQIVGKVASSSTRFALGEIVGLPWLGKSCGSCRFCQSNDENLCDDPTFTGYTIDGGYAEKCAANEEFVFPIPKGYDPIQATPLLCAGMIGYRALSKIKEAKKVGFYGFGSSAHLLIQLAKYFGQEIYVFTKKGDESGQKEAKQMGAAWAGSSDESPPELLDAAIIFAPIGELIPTALKALRKGGKVVCAGIHMSEIPHFSYDLLWGERSVESIANLTRRDGEEFLKLATEIPIKTSVTTYPLEKANEALADLRSGSITGTAVLIL